MFATEPIDLVHRYGGEVSRPYELFVQFVIQFALRCRQ